MHHTMDGLEMLDPASSMTTLTPMSDAPSITSPHHQLHGTYHGMNHMMGHHHGGPLGGHTPGMNHYGKNGMHANFLTMLFCARSSNSTFPKTCQIYENGISSR